MGSGAEDRPGVAHRDFLQAALGAAGEWTRYADPKVLGVLVLLGFGINDLIEHADRFVHPHKPESVESIAATSLFFVACVLAAFVVLFVTTALFSRLKVKALLGQERGGGKPASLFYFGEVRRYPSEDIYADAVLSATEQDLLRDVAGQVYQVSDVCYRKHIATQRAYVTAIAFLFAWVIGRIVLSTVT
jgi:hypothetical protein